jgi:hypothetical protein
MTFEKQIILQAIIPCLISVYSGHGMRPCIIKAPENQHLHRWCMKFTYKPLQ